jgi:uncharacterized repeat protein (TIGR03803 family)
MMRLFKICMLCAATASFMAAQDNGLPDGQIDATPSYQVLHTFTGGADGAAPYGSLIRDSAGNLYGTTFGGGTGNAGTVYKVDTSGTLTTLYPFTGGADGGQPGAGLIMDSEGNLYGTTETGGNGQSPQGSGVVFKVDTAGMESVLYTFTGGADGGSPQAGLVMDSAGNLYGTTPGGGMDTCPFHTPCGVVFELDTVGTETVLHSFTGGSDGADPRAGLIRDSAGNLYGTAYNGGSSKVGVVFKLDSSGTETVLHNFKNGPDGGYPEAGLLRDSAGNLYGTTDSGGTHGKGVTFKLNAAGKETVLHSFTAGKGGDLFSDLPEAGVIRDSAGNLYGTAPGGGTGSDGVSGGGVVYKLDKAGKETVLYNFSGGADGAFPYGGLIRDSAGNLYGTTTSGGSAPSFNGCGVVFKLKP